MPRRALPPAAIAPIPSLLPPPPPSPLIQLLRKDWRWAAISQFLYMFSDAFGLLDWDIEALEEDLDGSETVLLPDILAKLLYALTYNRQINRDNAMEHLRKQYIKRAPRSNVLGTIDEPIDWATLGLSAKVQILHELCEWQMKDPARFRALLKTEEEAVSWRIDPMGWDKAGNTYWLFDDNRLWIQRLPPQRPRVNKKPPPKSAKRAPKRSLPESDMDTSSDSEPSTSRRRAPKRNNKPVKRVISPLSSAELTPISSDEEEDERSVQPKVDEVSGPRKRTKVEFYGNVTPTASALSISGNLRHRTETSHGSGSKITRSSQRSGTSSQAPVSTPSRIIIKRESTNKTPSRPTPEQNGSSSKTKPLPRGTRVSRRLREVEDEWQQIPDEWLSPEKPPSKLQARKSKVVNDVDEDEGDGAADGDWNGSELSELSEQSSALSEEVINPPRSRVLRLRGGAGSDEDLTPIPEDGGGQEKMEVVQVDPAVTQATEVAVVSVEPVEQPKEAVAMDVDGSGEAEEDAKVQPKLENASLEIAPEEEVDENDEVKLAVKEANDLPPGFVEWEAVCVTLYDWRTFPETFAKSSNPDEKALYKLLVNVIGPTVIEVLVAKEQERLKQAAIINRKRSSRIAIKELEKEEQLRHEKARQEMEERMNRSRREGLRQAREETEAKEAEKTREERLRERENRLAAREEAMVKKAEDESREKERAEMERERRAKRRLENGLTSGDDSGDEFGRGGQSNGAPKSGRKNGAASKTDENKESWELNCEICRITGWNLDDNSDVVACEDCGRWQHTACHDRKDYSEGRPRRNWDKVDFKCKECRRRAARERPVVASPKSSRKSGVINGSSTSNGHAVQQPRRPDQQASQISGSAPSGLAHRAPPYPVRPMVQSQQQPYPQGAHGAYSGRPSHPSQPPHQQYPHPQQRPTQGYVQHPSQQSPIPYPPQHRVPNQPPQPHQSHPSYPPRPAQPQPAYPSHPSQHQVYPSQQYLPPRPHPSQISPQQRAPHISHSTVPHASSHPFGPGGVPRPIPNQSPSPSYPAQQRQPYPPHSQTPSQAVPRHHSQHPQNGHGGAVGQGDRLPHPDRIHLPPIHSLPLNGGARGPGAVTAPPITLPPLQSGFPSKGNGVA